MITPLEVAANAVMALSIVLAGRNNVHSWWLGVIGCSMFAVLFYISRLYADVALQGFFIVTCLIGWRQWVGGGGGALPISKARPLLVGSMAVAGLAATAAYGLMLQAWTDAYAPFIDSAVLMFSIIAQLLLMGRRLQTWPFWLMVNTVSIPLYASRGLYLTAALYAAYWFNALASWFFWRRQMRGQEAKLQLSA
ncbi:nicotinamide riboside transporter PnuC [Burkholderia sp. LMU1-1-1.1]|uniref:nicotinamide riboside transporter PnuC n=1 Tax=Burkholderia sp. LMU1-1-1.1 TaxID=3135266 RepID=UPI0034473DCC